MEVIGYKIFEQSERGLLCLFHGCNGSRLIEKNKIYKTGNKIVKDNGPLYEEGFHFLKTRSEAENYLKSFSVRLDKLKIVKCEFKNIHRKEHSPNKVWLAKEMRIV
jgi:hypothetical protein